MEGDAMGLAAGLRATVRHVVTEADTAIEAGSGDVPVLATPRLLALAEAACVAALESHLGEGMTSVGTGVGLEHRRASPVGAEIEVEAELTELTGRKLVFGFVARHVRPGSGDPADGGPAGGGPGSAPAGGGSDGDADLVVGGGTVERIVVDRATFLARAGVPAG
jgi:fluoroacetyl-CoA thioesterase